MKSPPFLHHLNHRIRFKQPKHKNMQEKKITEKRNYLDISSKRFVWIEFSKNFHWMWIFINSSFADVFILALFGTHWNYIHTKSIYAWANKTHSYDMLCLYFIESFNKKRKRNTTANLCKRKSKSDNLFCFSLHLFTWELSVSLNCFCVYILVDLNWNERSFFLLIHLNFARNK